MGSELPAQGSNPPACTGRRSVNQWASREGPQTCFLICHRKTSLKCYRELCVGCKARHPPGTEVYLYRRQDVFGLVFPTSLPGTHISAPVSTPDLRSPPIP